MAKVELSKESKTVADNLKTARGIMAKCLERFQTGMAAKDTQAARSAISAENDIAALDRVIKRVETGFYA